MVENESKNDGSALCEPSLVELDAFAEKLELETRRSTHRALWHLVGEQVEAEIARRLRVATCGCSNSLRIVTSTVQPSLMTLSDVTFRVSVLVNDRSYTAVLKLPLTVAQARDRSSVYQELCAQWCQQLSESLFAELVRLS